MKIDKSKLLEKLRISFKVIIPVILILGCGYSYARYRSIERVHLASLSILAKTTGQLVTMSKESKAGNTLDNSTEREFKEIIQLQSLTLIDGYIDIANLDAVSFDGLFLIVSDVDTLFPLSSEKTIQAATDNYLNFNLKRLQVEMNKEAGRRLKSKGNPRLLPINAN